MVKIHSSVPAQGFSTVFDKAKYPDPALVDVKVWIFDEWSCFKVKTEAGRTTFAFQGALIFNGLPPDLINESYFVNFKLMIDILSFA